jgi:hypothetical protein
MKPIVVSEIIDASAEAVFAAATDLPHAAERIKGITKIEMLTDGPVGVGTRWRETRVMFGREAAETMWITEFQPPRRYVVEARSHGTHYLTPITVEPLEPGRSKITMSFGAKPESLMAKIMMTLFAGMAGKIARCLHDDLRDIKRFCENGGPARAS